METHIWPSHTTPETACASCSQYRGTGEIFGRLGGPTYSQECSKALCLLPEQEG